MATGSYTDITITNGQTIGPRPLVYSSFDLSYNPVTDVVYAIDITGTNGSYSIYYWNAGDTYPAYNSMGSTGYIDIPEDLAPGNWTFTFKLYVGSTKNTGVARWGANTVVTTATRTATVVYSLSTTQEYPPSGLTTTAAYTDPSQPTLHQQFFDWSFGTNGYDDYQTSYEIHIRKIDTTNVGTYTGTTSSTSATIGISNTYKDLVLEWRIRTANRYGVFSPWTAYSSFLFATPPVSTITTPANNAALTSGVINIVTSATTGGGRLINKTSLSIWQGTTLIWSKVRDVGIASGQNLTTTDPTFILPQSGGVPYTLKVVHRDEWGIDGAEVSRNFTVTYTAVPAGAAPTASSVNYDSDGYITVTWPNTNVDASFYAWAVERRDRPLDPYTGAQIGSFGNWTEVGRVYVNGTSFTYQDFTAPSNSYLEYRIKQVAIRDGYQVISTTATAGTGVSAITSSYWLVNLTPTTTGTTAVTTVGGTALKLWNVTGDQYKRERVRNQYNLIGRGRYVEEGDKLGVTGTLNAQIRDSGSTTARTKRLDLQAFQDTSSRFHMRNPFGDTITVNIGDIDVTRIPGTGKSEFVDVTIPYSEVS
jgi:hypothetical protein